MGIEYHPEEGRAGAVAADEDREAFKTVHEEELSLTMAAALRPPRRSRITSKELSIEALTSRCVSFLRRNRKVGNNSHPRPVRHAPPSCDPACFGFRRADADAQGSL